MGDYFEEKIVSLKISSPPSMSDLPLDVIHKIVDKVKPIDRLSLRKVCRKFRAFVDDKDPGFMSVGVGFEYNQLFLDMSDMHRHCLSYQPDVTGYTVHFDNRTKRFIGNNSLINILNDFSVVMKNPKLRLKNLEFYGYDGNVEQKVTIMNWFKGISESRSQYKVKYIDLSMNLPTFAATILPYVQPGILETIRIDCNGNPDNMDEVFEMEQWKKANTIKIYSYGSKHFPLENLFHLKIFHFDTQYLSAADAIKIRDTLFKSAVFEKGIIKTELTISVEVMRVFDPNFIVRIPLRVDYDNGAQFRIYYGYKSVEIEKKK